MQARTVIEIPAKVEELLLKELRCGGPREIGGILMGECLEPGHFRVIEFTVDHSRGGSYSFVRVLRQALEALFRFFDRTEHNYSKYNYLGEWHSHPSFDPIPSRRDIESVQSIADDPEVGATFVTLLILRLRGELEIEASGTIFVPDSHPEPATLVFEGGRDLA